MKILYVTQYYPPEYVSSANRAGQLSAQFAGSNNSVVVLTTYPNHPAGRRLPGLGVSYARDEILGPTWRVHRFPVIERPNTGILYRMLTYGSFYVSGIWWATSHLHQLMRYKPDVVIATTGPFLVPWLGLFLARLGHCPLVVEFRDITYRAAEAIGMSKRHQLVDKMLRWLELHPAWHARGVVCVTEGFAEVLSQDGIPRSRLKVIRNGAQSSHTRGQVGPLDPVVLGYVGTLGVSQDLAALLRTWARVERLTGRARLILVGDGARRSELVNMAHDLGLNHVEFRPAVSHEQVGNIYEECTWCIVSLRNTKEFQETVPSKVYELLALGKPAVFLGPAGEASRIVSAAGGRCCYARDPADIASFLVNEIFGSDEEDLQLVASTESVYAAGRFTWDRLGQEYLKYLDEIVARTSRESMKLPGGRLGGADHGE